MYTALVSDAEVTPAAYVAIHLWKEARLFTHLTNGF